MLTVVCGIAVRGEHVLLTQRRDEDRFAGQWEFPGGKVESGEEPEEALVRELREELGIEAEVLAPYQFAYHVYEREPGDARGALHVLLLFYLVRFEGEPALRQVADASWVPITELAGHDILKGSAAVIEQLVRDHSVRHIGLYRSTRR